jgi:hypothetical protein
MNKTKITYMMKVTTRKKRSQIYFNSQIQKHIDPNNKLRTADAQGSISMTQM